MSTALDSCWVCDRPLPPHDTNVLCVACLAERKAIVSEQPAPYFTRPPYHTPHGTEEREVFLPEQGDPGDELSDRYSCRVCGITTGTHSPYCAEHADQSPYYTVNQYYANRAAVGIRPALAEWEAAGWAYQAALDREDVGAMRAADETFWELVARLPGGR